MFNTRSFLMCITALSASIVVDANTAGQSINTAANVKVNNDNDGVKLTKKEATTDCPNADLVGVEYKSQNSDDCLTNQFTCSEALKRFDVDGCGCGCIDPCLLDDDCRMFIETAMKLV